MLASFSVFQKKAYYEKPLAGHKWYVCAVHLISLIIGSFDSNPFFDSDSDINDLDRVLLDIESLDIGRWDALCTVLGEERRIRCLAEERWMRDLGVDRRYRQVYV